MKKSVLIIIISFIAIYSLHAQKVTGYWYGQANVEMAGMQNNYLTELIIAQKGNKVRGFFGYYFKDVYQSFLVKGTYDPQTRQIIIRNIPIIYFNTNSTSNSVDCITSFYGTMMVSKVQTTLTGYFLRDKKYTYTCPDLRVNYTLYTEAKVNDSVFKDMMATKTYWKHHPDDYVADATSSTAAKKEEKNAKNSSVKNNQPKESVAKSGSENNIAEKDNPDKNNQSDISGIKSTRENASSEKSNPDKNNESKIALAKSTQPDFPSDKDSLVKNNQSAESVAKSPAGNNTTEKNKDIPLKNNQVTESIVKPVSVSAPIVKDLPTIKPDILKINEQFTKRKQVVGKILEVESDSIRLSFYDNAEIDGDSISVFLNNELIVAHQELTERALNVYVKLDSLKEINEVSMFAENLGKYPPNTAVMVVNDGETRYEVFMSSDFKGNATVKFKRKKRE
ncbi:MAG TPA: hypothetical protein VMI12_17675 [Puia sp.]|nr:hypothetical protein [Puia sp.]